MLEQIKQKVMQQKLYYDLKFKGKGRSEDSLRNMQQLTNGHQMRKNVNVT